MFHFYVDLHLSGMKSAYQSRQSLNSEVRTTVGVSHITSRNSAGVSDRGRRCLRCGHKMEWTRRAAIAHVTCAV